MNVLVFNPGSSSLKFAWFDMRTGETVVTRGGVERVGTPDAVLRLGLPKGTERAISAPTLKEAAQKIFAALESLLGVGRKPDVLACRVVHGGARFLTPTRMTPAALQTLSELDDLAPLHNRPAVAVMQAIQQAWPDVPLVAVFDTAFHQTMPEVAYTYALPFEVAARYGLRRYGFHGISHCYVAERLLAAIGRSSQGSRLITCHLGNGASVCALRDGCSVDTSMGLTPLEGLVMGTRSGDLDPGLVLHLLRVTGKSVDEIEAMLNKESGLAGVSGQGGDVRDLEKAASQGDGRAILTLELFAYRAAKYIGAYAVALEGLDAVAFTGGIGEHSASVRARICRRLAVLGLTLDATRNSVASGDAAALISAGTSAVQAWVIPTDEERQIARETAALVSRNP